MLVRFADIGKLGIISGSAEEKHTAFSLVEVGGAMRNEAELQDRFRCLDGSFSADGHEFLRFIDAAIVDHRARRSEAEHFLDSVRAVPVLESVWR